MAATERRLLGRRKDPALNYRVEYRYQRDASGRSVGFPDWPSAAKRLNEVAVVVHANTDDELQQYLALLDAQPTPYDLYVVSETQISTVPDAAAGGIREFLVADPIADGLYQLTSLANSGRLSGYRTVVRAAGTVDDFATLLGSGSLAALDLYVHQRVTFAGIIARNATAVIPELSILRAVQFALRVSTKLPEIEGESRSLGSFVLRGSVVESLCTLRLDHQDFYLKYTNYIDEGLASERLGPVKADPHVGRAVEVLLFHLLDRAELGVEFTDELPEGWQPEVSGQQEYSPRAQAWALYHPDLTTRTPVRNASWSHLVGSMPMHFGQEMPLSPVTLNFSDPLSEEDRAAQVALAADHGITGFLVALRWDQNGLLPAEFLDALQPREAFPWAALLCHPVEVRTDPVANHPRFVAWVDPGTDHYAALAESVVAGFGRGTYLRMAGRPVILVQDLEMLVAPELFVQQLRSSAKAAGEDVWVGAVQTYLTTARPGEGLFPSFVDGLVQLPPASTHHRRWARLTSRVNGFSGHAIDLTTRDGFAMALAGRDDEHVIPGAMVAYDTTPVLRSQGEIGYSWNVFAFRRALEDAVRSVAWREKESRIVAINSWNGWSDLSQLEPSSHRQSSYLSTVRDVLQYPS